jgi:PIN domain nuclease of toxin-antitoxin system
MKLLLDTHVLIWWLDGAEALTSDMRALIEDPRREVCVSAASAYEVALKANLGRLAWSADHLRAAIQQEGFSVTPLDWRHMALAGSFPLDHRDPFDRLILASAVIDGAALVTADGELQRLAERVGLR